MTKGRGWGWLAQASCVGWPDLPWTSDARDVSVVEADVMWAVCRQCPVFAACGKAARAWRVTGGWWAGASREVPDLDETEWGVPVRTGAGRRHRVLTGAVQGAADFGGAA